MRGINILLFLNEGDCYIVYRIFKSLAFILQKIQISLTIQTDVFLSWGRVKMHVDWAVTYLLFRILPVPLCTQICKGHGYSLSKARGKRNENSCWFRVVGLWAYFYFIFMFFLMCFKHLCDINRKKKLKVYYMSNVTSLQSI